MSAAAADRLRENEAEQWRRVLFNAYTAGRFKKGVSFSALLKKFGLGYENANATRPKEEPTADEAIAKAKMLMEASRSGQ